MKMKKKRMQYNISKTYKEMRQSRLFDGTSSLVVVIQNEFIKELKELYSLCLVCKEVRAEAQHLVDKAKRSLVCGLWERSSVDTKDTQGTAGTSWDEVATKLSLKLEDNFTFYYEKTESERHCKIYYPDSLDFGPTSKYLPPLILYNRYSHS